jgi:hypothetical protein
MKRITLVSVLCLVAALQTAYSQEQKQAQEQPPTIRAAFCKIDVTNKTVRIVPWDGKTWRRDSARVLVWDDQTQLVSGANTLTMAQFVGGKPLDKYSRDVAAIQGERGVFHIKTVGGKEAVQRVEMMALFGGESFPAMVSNNGAQTVGGTKVHCRAGE